MFPLVKRAGISRFIRLPLVAPLVLMATVSSSVIRTAVVPRDNIEKPRTIIKKFESVAQEDGDGASVRRSIGEYSRRLNLSQGMHNSASKLHLFKLSPSTFSTDLLSRYPLEESLVACVNYVLSLRV